LCRCFVQAQFFQAFRAVDFTGSSYVLQRGFAWPEKFLRAKRGIALRIARVNEMPEIIVCLMAIVIRDKLNDVQFCFLFSHIYVIRQYENFAAVELFFFCTLLHSQTDTSGKCVHVLSRNEYFQAYTRVP